MTPDAIRTVAVDVLRSVAPELDAATLAPNVELREQLDLDSMDFLNFAIGLGKAFRIDVPEADYRRLATLDSCVAYLAARTGA
jgi:acyl carrier protein